MVQKKKLASLASKILPVEENQQGKLMGGFSAFSTSAAAAGIGTNTNTNSNTNTNAGVGCSCSCTCTCTCTTTEQDPIGPIMA
jgi:hypothetical protein